MFSLYSEFKGITRAPTTVTAHVQPDVYMYSKNQTSMFLKRGQLGQRLITIVAKMDE